MGAAGNGAGIGHGIHRRDKKFRIARRVSYFICGWLEGSYVAGDRPACRLLSLLLSGRGRPGPELEQLLSDIAAVTIRPCTQFLDVINLSELDEEIAAIPRASAPTG